MITFTERIVGLTLFGAAFFSALLAAPFPTLAAQDVVPPPPKTWPKPVEDRPIIGYLLVDQLEYQAQQGTDTLFWNIEGWLGGDYNKLWVKTEGDQGLSGDNGGEAEVQLLYSRLIAPFFYFQVGGRYQRVSDNRSDHSRGFGVLGVQGLAPCLISNPPSLSVKTATCPHVSKRSMSCS
jgi:uncharacterized protein involved in copper resistance